VYLASRTKDCARADAALSAQTEPRLGTDVDMFTERKVADGGDIVGSAQSDGWVLSFPLFACNQGLDFFDTHWRFWFCAKLCILAQKSKYPSPKSSPARARANSYIPKHSLGVLKIRNFFILL
jgi:hypothetical protein